MSCREQLLYNLSLKRWIMSHNTVCLPPSRVHIIPFIVTSFIRFWSIISPFTIMYYGIHYNPVRARLRLRYRSYMPRTEAISGITEQLICYYFLRYVYIILLCCLFSNRNFQLLSCFDYLLPQFAFLRSLVLLYMKTNENYKGGQRSKAKLKL